MRPITARFKHSWKVTVEVKRAGRDKWGDPLTPGPARTVKDCLFSQSSSTEGNDLSEVPDDAARLSAPPGADFASNDRVDIPGRGTYYVDGNPQRTPLGVIAQLTRTQKGGDLA